MSSLKIYLTRHLQNCIGALGHMARQPFASLLTITVIGIALALPSALNVVVRNGQMIAGGFEDIRDFSVYTKPGTSLDQADELRKRIGNDDRVIGTELITADEALATFRNDEEFGDLVNTLGGNPLPHTIIVRPDADASPLQLRQLKDRLSQDSSVDLVKLDTEWLQRLNA